MAPGDIEPFWNDFVEERELRHRRELELQRMQMDRLMEQQIERITAPNPFWEYLRTGAGIRAGAAVMQKDPAPLVTGEIMIALLPAKEDIDPTEIAHIRNWLEGTAAGKKVNWPGFPLCLRVNKKSRIVQSGVWECREDDQYLYVGNGTGVAVPLWAPSCMMAIARYYRLDEDKELVAKIHKLLAEIVARDVIPVMHEIAEDFHGNPIIEIAVHTKDKILAGKWPGTDSYRLLSGEPVVIDKNWVRLKM